MQQLVILSKLEQEYLLRVIEAAVHVRELRGFFLWTQGQLQALLPHEVMLCLQFGPDDALLRLECVHGTVLGKAALAALCEPATGLGQRLARLGRDGRRLPCISEAGEAGQDRGLAALQTELASHGFGNPADARHRSCGGRQHRLRAARGAAAAGPAPRLFP